MSHNKKEWIRVEVENLIAAYQQFPCLWNSRSSEYKDKRKRKKALATLGEMFNTNETEICRKLHNLRNQFGSELKKSRHKKDLEDEPYVSRWPYFKLLRFIQPSLETSTRSLGSMLHKTNDENIEEIADIIKIEESPVEMQEDKFVFVKDQAEQPARTAATERAPDELDTFGSFVANEIRSLASETLRKKLKRKIQRCILEVAEEEEL